MRVRTARRHAAAAVVGIGLGVFAPGATASAADRALELVTPPGSVGDIRPGGGAATPDGNVVCFNAEKKMGGVPSNGELTADDGFCARRTASGWQTEWVTGPAVSDPRGWAGAQVYFVSPDGARVAFASDMGIFPDFPGDETRYGTRSAFMWEDGQTRWLAPSPVPLPETRPSASPAYPTVATAREPLAVSEDLRHGIFESVLPLVPEDTNNFLDLYEWTPDGIRLVTRDGDGNAVGGWPGMGTDNSSVQAVPGSVSRNGSRVFFEHDGALEGSPARVRSAFMREGDELTHVSPRRGPAGTTPANVSFIGATADGSIAYLISAEQLTNEPKRLGNALYSYDIANDELSLVATAADDRGIVFLGSSPDGSTLVYRTGASAPELFIRHDGVERSLGRLQFQDTSTAFDAVGMARTEKRAIRISADGETVVFASFGAFDGSPGGIRQVYRWTPSNGVRRISKDAAGSAPRGAAAIGNFSNQSPGDPRRSPFNSLRAFPNLGRVMSADGSRIFFETVDPLVDADINGFVDVYEWRDGAVRLVSPGTQQADALYHDSSADGSTVFFTTMARLIPELDRNTFPDLYAAREGGGFPLPVETACTGELCQGEMQQAPVTPRSGSTTFDGPEDTQERASIVPRHTVMRLTATQRGALARRGRTILRVRANEKGVVIATVTARIARRNVVVARAVRFARGGATARVPLKLSKRARTVLRTNRRLRLVISVSYSESDTTVRQVVVLRG